MRDDREEKLEKELERRIESRARSHHEPRAPGPRNGLYNDGPAGRRSAPGGTIEWRSPGRQDGFVARHGVEHGGSVWLRGPQSRVASGSCREGPHHLQQLAHERRSVIRMTLPRSSKRSTESMRRRNRNRPRPSSRKRFSGLVGSISAVSRSNPPPSSDTSTTSRSRSTSARTWTCRSGRSRLP